MVILKSTPSSIVKLGPAPDVAADAAEKKPTTDRQIPEAFRMQLFMQRKKVALVLIVK